VALEVGGSIPLAHPTLPARRPWSHVDPLERIARLPLPLLSRCRIPEAVASVESRGAELRTRGKAREAVEAVWRAALALYRTGVHPALQLAIRHRGRLVLSRAIGHARGNAPADPPDAERVLADTATPFCLYSASKAITAKPSSSTGMDVAR
jgi:CubicO group peptidase (beta-lactamase class C family)